MNITKNIENLSIVVQWDAVDDFLHTTYTIFWIDDRDLFESATLDEQTSYTITGLTLNTVYTITVTAANWCGDGPEFRTRVSLPSTDTTSTNYTISLTVTASTTPMTTTVNPSTTSIPSSPTMTTNSIATTVNRNADTSASRNSDSTMTTAITNPGINITNMVATDEISKFLMYIQMYAACTT